MSSFYGGVIRTVTPDEATRTRLIRARIQMILNAPFFGHIAMRLTMLQVAPDCVVQTLATDGRYFFYNKEFVDSITDDELIFGVGHETVHVVFDHTGTTRRGDRDPEIWNIASDYVTNQILVDERIGVPVTSNGFKIYQDNKYRGWAVEAVYDDLIKSGKHKPKGQQMDFHMGPASATESGVDADGNPQFRISTGGDSSTPEERRLQQELRQAVIAAAKSVAAAKSAGAVPSGIERLIADWTEPSIDWRELLAVSYNSLFRDDYSYSRPSKKSWATNCVLPGLKDAEFVEVAIAIDMSGSISDHEAALFLGETYGLMRSYDNFKIHLWTFDSKTYGYATFTPDNLEELKEYKVQGGGGTSFEANWDFMRKLELVPQQFVMFTDGMPGAGWGDPDYTDTIFVITTKGIKPPFGRHAHFDLHEA